MAFIIRSEGIGCDMSSKLKQKRKERKSLAVAAIGIQHWSTQPFGYFCSMAHCCLQQLSRAGRHCRCVLATSTLIIWIYYATSQHLTKVARVKLTDHLVLHCKNVVLVCGPVCFVLVHCVVLSQKGSTSCFVVCSFVLLPPLICGATGTTGVKIWFSSAGTMQTLSSFCWIGQEPRWDAILTKQSVQRRAFFTACHTLDAHRRLLQRECACLYIWWLDYVSAWCSDLKFWKTVPQYHTEDCHAVV